jgi:hypothetical protein
MRGQYSTHCGRRPRPGEAEPDEAPGRLLLCVRCQAQVLICRCHHAALPYLRPKCVFTTNYDELVELPMKEFSYKITQNGL